MEGDTFSAQSLKVVQQPIWRILCERLKPAERDEVKQAIGASLIDENEDLFNEAEALADILGDVQLSTKALAARHQLCSNPQRKLVEAEIRMLMDKLRSISTVAAFSGSAAPARDPDAVIPHSQPKEKAIYNYLQSPLSQGLDGRPGTAASRPGTASTNRPGTASSRAASRPSTASSAGSGGQQFDAVSILQRFQDQLNVYDIDAVKEHLRQLIRDERALLLEDVDYLHALLEDEADLQAQAQAPPPSVVELKEYSHRLAEAVQKEEARVVHEEVVQRMFVAADSAGASKASRLRGMVGVSRQGSLLDGAGAAGSRSGSPGSSGVASILQAQRSDSRPHQADILQLSDRPARPRSGSGPIPSQHLNGTTTEDHNRQGTPPSSSKPSHEPARSSHEGPATLPNGNLMRSSSGHRLSRPASGSSSSSIGLADSGLAPSNLSRPGSRDSIEASTSISNLLPVNVRRMTPSTSAQLRPLPAQLGPAATPPKPPSVPSASSLRAGSSTSASTSVLASIPPRSPMSPISTTSRPHLITPDQRHGLDVGAPVGRNVKTVGIERLETEWDAAIGGVAAILNKHNYTPSAAATRQASS